MAIYTPGRAGRLHAGAMQPWLRLAHITSNHPGGTMDEDIVALLIPITAIFMSLLIPIVFTVVDYRRKRDIVEANHRERMAAIERGMELPALPESFYQSMKPARRSSYLLPGLVWLFVGIGLFVSLGAVAGEDVRMFGLIPAGVGLALLIYHFVEGRKLPLAGQATPPGG
jgi:hypothetical protein